jgi:hypothetical protein
VNQMRKIRKIQLGSAFALITILAFLLVNPASGAPPAFWSATLPTATLVPPDKNNGQFEGAPGGSTFAGPPVPGSKNAADVAQSMGPSVDPAAAFAAGGALIACGESGNQNWTTTSATAVVVLQCTLSAPQAGKVYISASTSLALQDNNYEVRLGIGIDGTTPDSSADRWVNVYTDTGDGTDKSAALSVLKPVAAGTHTFNLLVSRYAGAGTVLLYDPTLAVIFIPETNTQLLACGASANNTWESTSATAQVIRQCALTLPKAGWVFISADSSVARKDGEYEVRLGVGIDSTSPILVADRWFNLYNDAGDGADESAALTVLQPVAAGAHTFNYLGSRYSGTGTVLLLDPSLSVIFIPAADVQALACGAASANWTTTSSTYAIIRQCTLSVPQAGWVYIAADASVAQQDDEYEGMFGIGIDATSADFNIDRFVNLYHDSGDGTDRLVALSVLKPVAAGTHTVNFLGKRYSGTGTVLLLDPTLTVIAPGAQTFLPILLR